jgi:hypothetical protein
MPFFSYLPNDKQVKCFHFNIFILP